MMLFNGEFAAYQKSVLSVFQKIQTCFTFILFWSNTTYFYRPPFQLLVRIVTFQCVYPPCKEKQSFQIIVVASTLLQSEYQFYFPSNGYNPLISQHKLLYLIDGVFQAISLIKYILVVSIQHFYQCRHILRLLLLQLTDTQRSMKYKDRQQQYCSYDQCEDSKTHPFSRQPIQSSYSDRSQRYEYLEEQVNNLRAIVGKLECTLEARNQDIREAFRQERENRVKADCHLRSEIISLIDKYRNDMEMKVSDVINNLQAKVGYLYNQQQTLTGMLADSQRTIGMQLEAIKNNPPPPPPPQYDPLQELIGRLNHGIDVRITSGLESLTDTLRQCRRQAGSQMDGCPQVVVNAWSSSVGCMQASEPQVPLLNSNVSCAEGWAQTARNTKEGFCQTNWSIATNTQWRKKKKKKKEMKSQTPKIVVRTYIQQPAAPPPQIIVQNRPRIIVPAAAPDKKKVRYREKCDEKVVTEQKQSIGVVIARQELRGIIQEVIKVDEPKAMYCKQAVPITWIREAMRKFDAFGDYWQQEFKKAIRNRFDDEFVGSMGKQEAMRIMGEVVDGPDLSQIDTDKVAIRGQNMHGYKNQREYENYKYEGMEQYDDQEDQEQEMW